MLVYPACIQVVVTEMVSGFKSILSGKFVGFNLNMFSTAF